jgi:uncharacterized protein (DUF983 family)
MNRFTNALKGNCPKCGNTKIFSTKGSLLLFKEPKMNSSCSECGYHFDKEPGYFIGAMYISYGMAILELIPTFLIFFWIVPLWALFTILMVVLFGAMFFNFRFSRILWIHIFQQ